MKWYTKLDVASERCPIILQGNPPNVKVTQDKNTPILTQIGCFRIVTPVWIHPRRWHDAHSLKQHRRGVLLFFEVIREISRSLGTKNGRFWPQLSISRLQLQFIAFEHFEIEPQWLSYYRRQFQINFDLWKLLYFDWYSTKVCSSKSTPQWVGDD